MKQFKFNAQVTVSAYTVVVAETEEQAKAIANDRLPQLYTSWTRDDYPEEAREAWIIEEADGMPEKVELADTQDTDEEEADDL